MDLDEYFAKHSFSDDSAQSAVAEDFKSGFVALIGRPNAGKSTLMNKVVNEKVAITSKTSQTTRQRIRAILTTDDFQIVFVDTPGLHKPKDVLGEELNANALRSIGDADAIAMLIDSSAPIGRGDIWVADQIRNVDIPKICVLTKCDLVDQTTLANQQMAANDLVKWDAMVCLSSKSGYNVAAFVEECAFFLPNGPLWFPRDMVFDIDDETMVAEFIREKILRTFRDEVPHSVGVITEYIEYDKKKKLFRIGACIFTERDSQKSMIIGKGGKSIKQIGTQARQDLEHLFGARIYLDLSVKVKRGWRSDESQLKRFGYME